jgi:hypothetical protein
VTFHDSKGEQLRLKGMGLAADNAKQQLALARRVAAQIALRRKDRTVTADDVGRILQEVYGLDTLGPAAGSMFKTPDWKWTGQFRKSKRVTNHSRLLRVWRYVGDNEPLFTWKGQKVWE